MKAILLIATSLILVSCGGSGSANNPTSAPESRQENLRDIKMSGMHTGDKWDGAVAIMNDAEIFDRPALSFVITSKNSSDPCQSVLSTQKGIYVTIAKVISGNENEYDQYINFFDQERSRYLSSPSFEYQYKMREGVITALGILFDIDDSDYQIEGYVDVVDCR